MKNILLYTLLAGPFAAAAQGGLQIGSGSHLTTSGNPYVVIHNGSLTNDGQLQVSSGTFILVGDAQATATTIGGANAATLYDVVLRQDAAHTAQLAQDLNINGNLNMESGNLDLNGNDLFLGTTGLLVNEREEARVTGATGGVVEAILPNSVTGVAANAGNLGATLTPTSQLGTVVIRRGNEQQVNNGIARYYDISTSQNGTADLQINYFATENPSATAIALNIFHSTDGGVNWVAVQADAANPVVLQVSKNGVNPEAVWTLAPSDLTATANDLSTGKETSDQLSSPTLSPTLAPELLVAFPNPTFDDLQLSFDTEHAGIIQMELRSGLGQVIAVQTLNFAAGNNRYTIDMRSFAAGTYYYTLTFQDGSRATAKVLKANL